MIFSHLLDNLVQRDKWDEFIKRKGIFHVLSHLEVSEVVFNITHFTLALPPARVKGTLPPLAMRLE